jgi:hypothetical protein
MGPPSEVAHRRGSGQASTITDGESGVYLAVVKTWS